MPVYSRDAVAPTVLVLPVWGTLVTARRTVAKCQSAAPWASLSTGTVSVVCVLTVFKVAAPSGLISTSPFSVSPYSL